MWIGKFNWEKSQGVRIHHIRETTTNNLDDTIDQTKEILPESTNPEERNHLYEINYISRSSSLNFHHETLIYKTKLLPMSTRIVSRLSINGSKHGKRHLSLPYQISLNNIVVIEKLKQLYVHLNRWIMPWGCRLGSLWTFFMRP